MSFVRSRWDDDDLEHQWGPVIICPHRRRSKIGLRKRPRSDEKEGRISQAKQTQLLSTSWVACWLSLAIAAPIACWFCRSAGFGEKISARLKSKSCAHRAQYGPRRYGASAVIRAWPRTPLLSHLLHLANNGQRQQPVLAITNAQYLSCSHALYLKVLYNSPGNYNSPAAAWTRCHHFAVAQRMKLIHAAIEVANNWTFLAN